MRRVEYIRPGHLEWREVTSARLQADTDALVRPFAVATCDLDRAIVRGQTPATGPFAFGHEGVAEVIEVGDRVRDFAVGDVVAIPFQQSCGGCTACREGRTAHCEGVTPMSMYGLGPFSSQDCGGFLSDWVRVPFADHMLVPIPAGVDPVALASLSDNIADGWRLVAPPLQSVPGAAVLVVAGASVSLYATAIALALGASRVDFVGGEQAQQEIAARLGAKVIEGTPPDRLGPYPITVNASSDRICLRCALRSTAPDGICTSAGIFFGQDTPLPLWDMYIQGVMFRTGRVHARTVMPRALELAVQKRIHPEWITSETADWEDAPQALARHEGKLVISRPRLADAPEHPPPLEARS